MTNDPGNRYNIPLINALVLYVGTQAITAIQAKGMSPSTTTIAHSSHMDIFQNLAVDLDTEGLYQLLLFTLEFVFHHVVCQMQILANE